MTHKLCLCTSCGSTVSPQKRHKGSVWIEFVLLTFSLVLIAISFVLAALMFVVFIVYCVWRLTTGALVCHVCGANGLIPVTSPLAQQFLANQAVTDPLPPQSVVDYQNVPQAVSVRTIRPARRS